jgi:CRISPR-associated protein Csm3
VRDILLSEKSLKELEALSLDRPYTEVKTEVAIDRITSAATPRPVERVPAGATFRPGEMVYTMYSCKDGQCSSAMEIENLSSLFEGMALVEDDYLGGMGSRGSGKVAFRNVTINLRKQEGYFTEPVQIAEFEGTSDLITGRSDVKREVRKALGL